MEGWKLKLIFYPSAGGKKKKKKQAKTQTNREGNNERNPEIITQTNTTQKPNDTKKGKSNTKTCRMFISDAVTVSYRHATVDAWQLHGRFTTGIGVAADWTSDLPVITANQFF